MASVSGMVPWVKRIAKGLTHRAALSTMGPMVRCALADLIACGEAVRCRWRRSSSVRSLWRR
eukprot:7869072-Alexandrium_andersonii.AAC.1